MKIQWGKAGAKKWENGVSNGVLFLRDNAGLYTLGVPWNGLTTVTESPSGAESSKQYADNKVYANLKSSEEFGATVEAFTYPDEFGRCNGEEEPVNGVFLSQQGRETFGFSYVTNIGNDLTDDAGVIYHFVYGCDAAPSEVSRTTVNEDTELANFSYEVTATKVDVPGINPRTNRPFKPTAHVKVDSTKTDPDALQTLLDIVYGTDADDPRMPLPGEIMEIVGETNTVVNLDTVANKPSFVEGTGVITLPNVAGVQWKVNNVNKAPGAQPAIAAGTTAQVTATPVDETFTLVGDENYSFKRPA